MINDYKNAKTRKVHETEEPKGFKGLDGALAAIRLDELEAALSIDDISPLRSINLHALKGNREGQWAINVNGPWRICFVPSGEGFRDVEITNYHKG